MVYAHPDYQYRKWKAWLNGEIKVPSEMYMLARTYINEIIAVCGYQRMKEEDERIIFNEFAQAIMPPNTPNY